MKNILKGTTSRLNDTEEQTSNVEERLVKITKLEQQKKKVEKNQ